MNPKEMLAAAQLKVANAAKLVQADASEENIKALEDANVEHDEAFARVERAQKALGAMERSAEEEKKATPDVRVSLGERFTKSESYEGFQSKYPNGAPREAAISLDNVQVGSLAEYEANRKAAMTTDIAHLPPQQFPMVDQTLRPRLSLLDLISRGSISTSSVEYLQITAITRNADIVPENTGNDATDTLKPISELSTQLADAKVYAYADGYTVTNQLLADAPALATFLNNEFRYSLSAVIEDKLLNGTGTSGEPRGLLETTGVQQLTYTAGPSIRNLIEAVRKAKTKITLAEGTAQAVLINPEDDEAIDLLADNDGRYFSNGPFGLGPSTLWGLPRVLSTKVPVGTAITGEFTQLALLDREGLSVVAFNQHKDYAQRNLTYVRAELRAAQVNWRPARFAVIESA